MSDFIKLDRKILKWEWYKNEHTKNVFFHCLLKAYWKDTKIEGKIIPRGSFVSSIGNMAEELSLTPMEVRTAIKHLKLTNEITSKGTSRNTVFTITNYDAYQAKQQTKQQTDNEQITNEQQTINEQLTTNKEDKEDKEEKKDTHLAERKQIIEYLNQKCGTKYRHGSELSKKHINARLNEGYVVEDFFKVIDKKYDEWHGTEHEKYLTPETLFGNKFEKYLNQKINKEKQKNGFNNFPQNEYDFDELEKVLLDNIHKNGNGGDTV